MRYDFERGPAVNGDLESIFDFLFESYVGFGEHPDEALERAAERVTGIEDAMEALIALPHQGTLLANLMPGMRCVTKERAVFYFTVDEEKHVVHVLAVFFGAQDHQRAMLKRAMGDQ